MNSIVQAIAATRFVQLSEDDLLESVKRQSNGSAPTLHEESGIYFYSCGSNASHHFSLGVKDGKLWSRSQCYDWWVDADGIHEIDEDNIREVDPSKALYLGSKN